ncbi:VOC family protein [Blastopirellula retiformator]|uniref:Glyoxalase-like domain protein n=1 Tax=Blastopirellula retiformator TaxID=2527970 RepID=A0A5C5VI45_9BACT|nr:VOC family protein [Blastopirellula retiformator]TWT38314.1 Glyoxalase-like domain protein [Blastopirellula retiformator]
MPKIRRPNLQLVHVSDIDVSTKFYTDIFGFDPFFITPRYVVFKIDGDADFAIWSGGDSPDPETPRFSEIGINLDSDDEVTSLYKEWSDREEVSFAQHLHTAVFGETFQIKDPDGHIIRVSSKD